MSESTFSRDTGARIRVSKHFNEHLLQAGPEISTSESEETSTVRVKCLMKVGPEDLGSTNSGPRARGTTLAESPRMSRSQPTQEGGKGRGNSTAKVQPWQVGALWVWGPTGVLQGV